MTTDTGSLLAKVVGPEHVLAEDRVPEEYGHDESLTAAARRPMYVVRPGTTAEVSEILAVAGARRVPVTARGSGTGLCGACVPATDGIVLSFERMDRVLEIDTDNHVAVVQPGVTLAELDRRTAESGLCYPVHPGESSASVGGTIATNTGGMHAVRHGVTRHHVLTSGLWLPEATAGVPRHDWLTLTGGAIGQGLPLAAGAAIACPDRPVLCLEADGSAMYTLSALWTHAREGLDITTVIFANGAYAVLGMEAQRLGAPGGPAQRALTDLTRPGLDFVALARGMGVPASRATTAEEFTARLREAFGEPGPHLVEAVVPALF